MSAGILIDTSLWIEALRRTGDEAARATVAEALDSGLARLAPPVLLELHNGARGKKELDTIEKISATVPLLEANQVAWERAHSYARRLRAGGRTTRVIDILIQAIGDAHGAKVVSLDSDFQAMQKILRQKT